MIYCKPIEYPPAPFNPGDRVRFLYPEDFSEGGSHFVRASDHCFTWLEGRRYGVPNWQLRRTHKARQNTTEEIPKRDRKSRVNIDSKNLPPSENLLKSTHP